MKAINNIKTYKRAVSNKMQGYGLTDFEKKTVKINKSKTKNGKGEVLDTIVHEKEHILHPKKYERTVRKDTARKINKMTGKAKSKHYALFKK